jgi:hypothetical protein
MLSYRAFVLALLAGPIMGLVQPVWACAQFKHVCQEAQHSPEAPQPEGDQLPPQPADAADAETSRAGEAESETEVALPLEGFTPALLTHPPVRAAHPVCMTQLGERPGVHRPPAQA